MFHVHLDPQQAHTLHTSHTQTCKYTQHTCKHINAYLYTPHMHTQTHSLVKNHKATTRMSFWEADFTKPGGAQSQEVVSWSWLHSTLWTEARG